MLKLAQTGSIFLQLQFETQATIKMVLATMNLKIILGKPASCATIGPRKIFEPKHAQGHLYSRAFLLGIALANGKCERKFSGHQGNTANGLCQALIMITVVRLDNCLRLKIYRIYFSGRTANVEHFLHQM
jgi:hypothetical protein